MKKKLQKIVTYVLAIALIVGSAEMPMSVVAAAENGQETFEESEEPHSTGIEERDALETEQAVSDESAESESETIEETQTGQPIEEQTEQQTEETAGEESSQEETVSEESVSEETTAESVETITKFEELEEAIIEVENKPLLEEAAALFPKEVTAYLESGETVTVPVTWECVDDYTAELESYTFQVVAVGKEYTVGDETKLPQVTLVVMENRFPSLEGDGSLQRIDFVERAKNNRVYMRESSSCAIASVASVEGYVANIGISEAEQEAVYNEVKECNGNSLWANWSNLGYDETSTNGDYRLLYEKLAETGFPVIVHRTTGGGHYSVVVGFEDKNNNSVPEANEFLVMESQKYERIYDGAIGYLGTWETVYETASRVPLNEWQVYVKYDNGVVNDYSAVFDQIVWRTTGMTLSSLKDEPAKSFSVECTKPEGNMERGSYFTVSGIVKSNHRLKTVTATVSKDSAVICKGEATDINRYSYRWGANSKIDNAMTFSSLSEGTYTFEVKAVDASGAEKKVKSTFTVVPRGNQSNVQTPTISLNTKYNYLDETSAERTAVLKNPGKQRISQCGMILYDRNRNAIARCSEALNKYDSELWIYYATNNRTNTNLNIKLVPGTQYFYEIYAYVGNNKYTVNGDFTTKGSAKPQTPVVSVTETEYAVGDVAAITWNDVDYVTDGYQVILSAMDDSYRKVIDTKMTTANFVLPSAGEYKAAVIAKGYEWSDTGWLDKTIKVHGDSKVTFVMETEDGSLQVLKEDTVKYRQDAVAPPVPSKTGWIFQGWDKSYLNVKEDMTVKAMFMRNKYSVKFQDPNGVVLKEARVDYEGQAAPPENINVPAGYLFVGWDNEDYKYVTKNTAVTASYVYENANLPLQLEVGSCGFDSDGTGYTVLYNVTNYNQGITKGRVIVSLMSQEGRLLYTTESNAFTLKASQKKENVEIFVPFEGEAAYAEVVIVDSFITSIPISEKKTVAVTRSWSAWSTQAPSEGAAEIESRTEYRYRDKSTTVSNSASLAGWSYESTEGYWSDYGAWSGWSRNQYWGSDSRQVESRTVIDQQGYSLQEYYFFKYYKAGVGWMYSYADRSGQSGVSNVEFKQIWINTSGDSRTMVYNGIDDGITRYTCQPNQFYQVEYFYKGSQIQNIPAVTHTEWRCRDRQYLYRYHLYKWSDWSGWTETPYTSSSTREVEQRTVYRYKTTAAPSDEWSGEVYTVSGKVSENLAGKQALLVVYKGMEPADYNNEYLGQTKIGEDGSYSFTFLTREEPSVETGDFTVKLGIEGAKELLYLETIKAPKPEYQVKFMDWDGTVISEQTVLEGETADAPENPEREGYRFTGWDTGLTNVHDDLEVVALYEKVQCTVTFVDWSQNVCKTEIYDVGADIIYPSWKEIEGYEFQGWFDEDGEEVTKAEQNLVLTAVYEVKEFTVTFYSQSGEVLSTQTAKYGEAVNPPAAPEIEGQRFACWSTYEYSNVQKTLDIFPSYEYFETTDNPSASIKSCTLEKPIQVTLTCPDKNAAIFYTLDGSKPDMFAKQYTEPITIDKNAVLQFFAKSENKNDSTIVSEAYLMMNAEDDQGAVVIKKDQLNLQLGKEAPQITYFLYHENPDIGVEFHSLDESIVSVDETGQLFVNNVGETQIFVVTKDYRYADYCDITVTSDEIGIKTLDIAQKDVEMYIGDELDLETKITPSDATYQNVIWSSENENVVSIDQEGHLVANTAGNTYISAYSHSGTHIAYCFVSVENISLSLSEQEIVLAAGQKYQLNAKAGGQKLTWKTDNSKVISVSEEGLVTANMPGIATVLVSAENGDFRACTVRVTSGTIPADPPEAPVIDEVTATTISVVPQEGCEYSLDAMHWSTDTVFRGLMPDTIYTIFARVRATEEKPASSASLGRDVRTKEQGIRVSEISEQTFTGRAIKPEIEVYYGDELLVLNKDYTLSYKNNVNVSDVKPTVTIKGKGYYSSSVKTNFRISAKNIEDSDVEAADIVLAYNKRTQKPVPTLTYNGKKLVNQKDFTVKYISEGEGVYKNSGVYSIEVTGKGNYTGSRIVEMEITDKILIGKAKISVSGKLFYNGSVQIPEIAVSYKGTKLEQDKDYKVEYISKEEGAYMLPGTYPVKIVGLNDFAGSKIVNIKISGISIKKAEVAGIENLTYTGKEREQDGLTVSLNGKSLIENKDYKVVYSSNIKAGKARIEIVGINGYSGKVNKSFRILSYDMETDEENLLTISEEADAVPYVKGGCVPEVEIRYGDTLLIRDTDYTLKYSNNAKVNDGTDGKKMPVITINGKGNFKGTLRKEFVIEQQNISKLYIEAEDIVYKAKKGACKVKPVIYDLNGKKLAVNKDYSKNFRYTYADGSEIGVNEIPEAGSELMVTVEGIGGYEGQISAVYCVVEKKINKVSANKIKRTYTGTEIELKSNELILKDGKYTLVEGRDYEILEDSYKRNVNPGTASVTIRGLGDYGGQKKINFTISKKNLFY